MSCCGGQYRGTTRPVAHDRSKERGATIAFVYVGRSSLSAIGGATGRCYRFGYPGCCLEVDVRDGPSLMAIDVLRR